MVRRHNPAFSLRRRERLVDGYGRKALVHRCASARTRNRGTPRTSPVCECQLERGPAIRGEYRRADVNVAEPSESLTRLLPIRI